MKKANLFSVVLFVIIVVVFAGCQKEQTSEDVNKPLTDAGMMRSKESAPTSTYGTMDVGNKKDVNEMIDFKQQTENYNSQDKRMIIRSGTMNLEVDKYDDTEGKVKEIAARFNGYITNTSASLNASGKKQGTITIRVPSDKFDGLLTELSKTGKVMNQNITGQDVTAEYMDSEARLKTQRELESRLLQLLAEKTAKLTDVVEVETKLAAVRENIERTEGRMRYLKDQASYSTLAVSVYEPSMLTTSSGGGFFYELGQGFEKGLTGFTTVLRGIITFVIAFLPIFIILFIIFYYIRKYLKKRRAVKTV